MTKTQSGLSLLAFSLLVFSQPSAHAQIVSDPAKIGAFSGAMRYCEDRYEGREGRYRWARLKSAEAISDMRGYERSRALVASMHSYEEGRYLGSKLDRTECRGLLKLSEWKQFFRD